MSLKSLIVRIRGDNKNLKSSMKDSEKSVNRFSKTVKRLGAAIVGVFAIRQIVKFGAEMVKLAARTQGVKRGFDQLNDPGLLDNLRKATHGTVSDLDLMQKAVQARNLGVPIENLGKMFEFATIRAAQAGEEVEYLTNSIVIGLGRKSPLILDNLGITINQLNKELKGAAFASVDMAQAAEAVGKVAEKEMVRMGGYVDTVSLKLERANARWKNMKRWIGESIIESGLFKKALDALETVTEKLVMLFADDAGKSAKILGKEALENLDKMNFRYDLIKNKEEEINKRREKGLKPTATQIAYLARQNELYEKAQDRVKELTALIRLKNKEEKSSPIVTQRAGTLSPISGTGINTPESNVEGFNYFSLDNLKKSKEALKEISSALVDLDGIRERMAEKGAKAIEGELIRLDEWKFALQSAAMELSSLITGVFENLFTALGAGDFKNLFGDILANFGKFITQIGKLLVAYGAAMMAFSLLSKSPDPISAGAAIVAGLAAIAIGSAITGAASKGDQALAGGSTGGGGVRAAAQPQTVQVYGRLRGSDIVIVSDRSNSNNSTIT